MGISISRSRSRAADIKADSLYTGMMMDNFGFMDNFYHKTEKMNRPSRTDPSSVGPKNE
jgi:hypothetical protein